MAYRLTSGGPDRDTPQGDGESPLRRRLEGPDPTLLAAAYAEISADAPTARTISL